MEVPLNEIDAIAIDRVHKLLRLAFRLAPRHNAPNLLFPRGIEKHAKSFRVILKKMLRSPSNDDALSGAGRVPDDTLRQLHDRLTVDEIQLVGVDAALIAPAQERFEKAVIERIVPLLAHLHNSLGAAREPGDLLGQ